MVSLEIGVLALCAFSISVYSAPAPGESQMKLPKESESAVLMDPATVYIFGYQSDDGLGTVQHRHEESDGFGAVKGSYGYTDSNGVYRTVNYTADANGYRAEVRSNEPGFGARSTGDALYVAESPIIVARSNLVRAEKVIS